MPAPGTLATILKMGADVSQLVTGLNQGLSIIQKFGSVVTSVMNSVVSAAQRGVQALQRVAAGVMRLSGEAARLDSMRDSFNKMSASFGETGQALLKSMREATLGMTKDADLIQSSMTAMMLISKEAMGDVSETIPMFAKIATSAARALGEDVSFMFDSLVRGIGRASPMILDNLGFTIRLSQVYGDFAKELGKTTKQLTTVERQQALINVVMEQGVGYVEQLGISTGGLATKQKQLRTEMQNLNDTMGQAVMPLVQALQGLYSDLATTIIGKLIPAFRMLGRVFSEVFGTKNPFMRWIEGDQVGKTAERIKNLEGTLADIQEMGPDFMGEVTGAWDTFNEELAELQEKFGPRLAKITRDMEDRIQGIWEDFHLQQARKDEDSKEEELRRTADHYEELEELRRRYDEDISDAIRKRDARALLNLLRRQKEEVGAKETDFDKETTRREQDREKERRRAKEDAENRVTDAIESANKQASVVRTAYTKALAKIEEVRDKSIEAAGKAWEAELAAYEEQIQTQKELIIKQMMEEEKLRAEMERPLPPFWEAMKGHLTTVWEWLQKVHGVISSIIDDPSISNVLEQLGLSPDTLSNISTKVKEIRDWILDAKDKLVEFGQAIGAIAGPEFIQMWNDLKVAFETLKPYWPDIQAVLKAVGQIIISVVVATLIVFMGLIRGLVAIIPIVVKTFGKLAAGLRKIWSGILAAIEGGILILIGIVTGNMKILDKGWAKWWNGIVEQAEGIWLIISGIIGGALEGILVFFEGFFTSVTDVFTRLSNTLVGHSIIPNMLDSIQNAVSGFLSNLLQRWQTGWDNLVGVVRDIWALVTQIVQTATAGVSGLITGWAGNLRNTLSAIFAPVENIFNRLRGGDAGGRGLTGAGANMSVNANNWNIYGGGDQSPGEEVWGAVQEVVTGAMSAWTRRR